jgi:hypothetical protein
MYCTVKQAKETQLCRNSTKPLDSIQGLSLAPNSHGPKCTIRIGVYVQF